MKVLDGMGQVAEQSAEDGRLRRALGLNRSDNPSRSGLPSPLPDRHYLRLRLP